MRSNVFRIDGEKLKKEIKKRGMTANEVSLELGYSDGYISKMVSTGKMHNAAATLLESLFRIPRTAYEFKEEEPRQVKEEAKDGIYAEVYRATYNAVYNAIDDSGILDALKELKEVWK